MVQGHPHLHPRAHANGLVVRHHAVLPSQPGWVLPWEGTAAREQGTAEEHCGCWICQVEEWVWWSFVRITFRGYDHNLLFQNSLLFIFSVNASVTLMLRHPPPERKILGSNPLAPGFFWVESYQWLKYLKIGTPVTTLPDAWPYRVSAGTGRPSVSILGLCEVESLICSFFLSVAAKLSEEISPWDTLACCWDVKQPTNKQSFLVLFSLCRAKLWISNFWK